MFLFFLNNFLIQIKWQFFMAQNTKQFDETKSKGCCSSPQCHSIVQILTPLFKFKTPGTNWNIVTTRINIPACVQCFLHKKLLKSYILTNVAIKLQSLKYLFCKFDQWKIKISDWRITDKFTHRFTSLSNGKWTMN